MLRVVSILLILLATVYASSRVKITSNGYTEIVVAFHNDINETVGFPLIQKIKDLFTSGSGALYRATRQRAYFEQVTILVPKTWTKQPEYEIASYEVFTEADVHVKEVDTFNGYGPQTLQPTPCGQQARYIHLTPEYLEDLDGSSTKNYGDPGKTLTHEWAHYRYGIFDEYPEEYVEGGSDDDDDTVAAFYIDLRTEAVLPSACTNAELVGEEWNPTKDRSCSRQRNGLPEKQCIFIPNRDKNDKITSSIASYHFLPNAYTFCDDTEEFKHNEDAPTIHNRLCNSRSTWNVITSHNDFINDNNPPKNIDNTTPKFKIVQQEDATFCFVLDISGSMAGVGITMLKEAASRWLKEEARIGSSVGIVLFSDVANLEHPIVTINNATRQSLIAKVPNKAGGGTCIGCGLRVAITELKKFRRGAPGGIIVLLSDGGETTAPFIADVQKEIVDANIRVVTMAFTAAASENLEKLADATGGKTFSIPTGESVNKLQSSFQEVGTYQTTNDDLAVKIDEQRFQNSPGNFKGSFVIDSTIGRDTEVRFLYTDRNDIADIVITKSGGWRASISAPTTSVVEDIRNLKQIKFTFKELSAEKYSYRIERSGSRAQDITVSVLSKSRQQGQEAIRITCSIEEVVNSKPVRYLITADVRKGTKPVIHAEVLSEVILPNGKAIKVQLTDTGKRGDITRNDGVYSGYFTQYIGKGRYSVSANVISNTMTSVLERDFLTSSRALPVYTKHSKLKAVKEVATGDFQRVADAGSIQITTNINTQIDDVFPPSQITDLRVNKVADDNSYVVLKWSAPGDDFENGRAEKYELKYTMNRHELLKTFFGVPYNVTIQPQEAGETETLQVPLKGLGYGVQYYVAIRARDDSDNWSDVSNIAVVRGNEYDDDY